MLLVQNDFTTRRFHQSPRSLFGSLSVSESSCRDQHHGSSNPSNPSVMSPLFQVRRWSDSHCWHPVHLSVPTMMMTHVSLHKLQIPKLISGVVTNDVQMFSCKNPLSQPWPQPVLQKTPVNPSDHSVGELSTLAVGKQGPTSWLHFRYSTRW